jgi:hypothetical protein
LKAGEHCMFCAAQAVCPKRRQMAEEHAKIDFAEAPHEIAFEQREAEVAKVLAWLPMIDSLGRAVTQYAQRALESGYKVGDFKLVRGKSNRKIRDDVPEKELVTQMTAEFPLKANDLYTDPELKSGPAIEKLLPRKLRKAFDKAFLVKPEGRLTIADGADPRPAVVLTAGDDFDDEPEADFG